MGEFNEAMTDLHEEMEDLSNELSSLGRELSIRITDQVVTPLPPRPPEPPSPGQPPPPPTPNKLKEKDAKKLNGKESDLQKKLADLQDRAKKRQEEFEAEKPIFRVNVEQV